MAETEQAAWKVSYRNISPKMKISFIMYVSFMHGSPFPPYKKQIIWGVIIMDVMQKMLKDDKSIILT